MFDLLDRDLFINLAITVEVYKSRKKNAVGRACYLMFSYAATLVSRLIISS